MIEALEDERFAALGAPVFVRGHLRRYAELLGEPEDAAAGALRRAAGGLGCARISRRCRSLPVQPPQRRVRRWPLVVLALTLVLAIAVWWALRASPT